MDAQRQIRENTLELHDFVKNLEDWERTVKTKDEQLRSESRSYEKKMPPNPKTSVSAADHTYDNFRDKWDKFDVKAALTEADEDDHRNEAGVKASAEKKPALLDSFIDIPQRYSSDKSFVSDAAAEKELGNDFFKEKKYVQAIECYSRSIGLHPTAVAYANRAMALLKIRRYEDAEMDCSEAIALDDRYTKAYARRGTARKERNKLLEAVEDFEFALRLEPHNKELEKQYQESKTLYEKKNPFRPAQKKVQLDIQRPKASPSASSSSAPPAAAPPATTSTAKTMISPKAEAKQDETMMIFPRAKPKQEASAFSSEVNLPKVEAKPEARQQDAAKRERMQAVQAAAERAAAAARTAVVQNMSAPKTSYEFESLWRGFGDDQQAKARLIKLMDPALFPRVFRDFLSASLLVDILKTLTSTIAEGNPTFSTDVLENLTKVGRFTMTAMCFSSSDKIAIRSLFEKLSAIPAEKLVELKTKYRV